MKASFLMKIVVLAVMLSVLLTGCSQSNPASPSALPAISNTPGDSAIAASSSNNFPAATVSTVISSTPAPTAAYPLEYGLRFSKLPKIGETAEMTFFLNTRLSISYEGVQPFPTGLENAHSWVEFYWTDIYGSYTKAKTSIQVPASEVVLNGETEWRGSYRKGDSISVKSTIRLPREGIWYIKTFISGDGWRLPSGGTAIRIASAKGLALDMRSPEFKSSPLAYLDFLPYGSASNIAANELLSDIRPVIVVLDLAKAPRAGEEVPLTCTIYSLYNVPNCYCRMSFERRTPTTFQPGIPGDDFLIDGKLRWQGDLQAGIPLVLESALKFPGDGDWKIRAYGNSREKEDQREMGYGDNIDFSITDNISFFGWPKRPILPGG